MMSLESIRAVNRRMAEKAQATHRKPKVYTGDPEEMRGIPHLGDYEPEGWVAGRELFVDSSGLGEPGEPALTWSEFCDELVEGRAYAIFEAGQFQVRVREFTRAGG